MKIGIFPGSFNPPTKAHFEIVDLLYNKKILDKIIFIPVKNNGKDLISLEHRINMLKFYTNDNSYLEVSSVMINYSKFNYQVLGEFNDDLYIIVGSDLLKRFHTFDNYQMMLEKYKFIIVNRDDDVNSLIEKYYYNYQDKFIVIEYCNQLSSTLVREYINSDMVSEMIDNRVLDYIRENKLYKDE